MTIVKRIGQVETSKQDRPVDDVKIVKAYVIQWEHLTLPVVFIIYDDHYVLSALNKLLYA